MFVKKKVVCYLTSRGGSDRITTKIDWKGSAVNKEPHPEIPSERADDLHNLEILNEAQLVLFMAGNQFMVMDDLIRLFQERHPEVKYIFYETLPPGLELRQILAGGALFKGELLTGNPDIYTSVTEHAMQELKDRGQVDDYFIYLHNRLVLMVPEGNPSGVRTAKDLGRSEVRISQPGEMEDISHYIIDMYAKAGGDALVKKIVDEKKARGTTLLTVVHHRETPSRIEKGIVDVGPVWATEVMNARRQGLKVEAVEPGESLDQRDRVNYFAARLKNAPNRENADKFLNFIKSAQAQETYRKYGFVPHFI
jgi:molybdate transport system substrate-binding protein